MTAVVASTTRPGTDRVNKVVRRLLASPSGAVGAALTAIVLILVILSIARVFGDPLAQDAAQSLQGPSIAHPFGTDRFGRDLLARCAAGLANSLLVSVVAVAFATVIGTAAGLVAGFFRKAPDRVIGALTNILFAFPPLLLALALASAFQRTWFTIAVAIGVVYVPIFVRVTRGPVLSLREADFVRAATVLGMGRIRVLFGHVLPNITSIVIVQVTLSLSWAVLTEASLSFLGLGTPPPAPSLGSMVFDASTLVYIAPWTMIAPGAVLVVFVVGLNLLGDGLRDALDPKNRG
jgi:peptide/nickel transport system permease protein